MKVTVSQLRRMINEVGTTDGAPPEDWTEGELSRIKDVLDACERLDDIGMGGLGLGRKVWDSLPHGLKVEFNYAKWEYRPLSYGAGRKRKGK